MYSFVIKIAKLVDRAVLDEIIMPTPGLMRPIVELLTADPASTSISVMINNTFFFYSNFYISFYIILYQF